jgi:hypothetical protein
MKKNKLIALFAGLSLAFVSSAALAAPSADTLLVAGYDSDQMAVLYGVSGIDQEGDEPTLDCTLTGDFVYELDAEAEEDAVEVAVTGLKTNGGEDEEDGDVEFFLENDEDQTEGVLYGTVADGDEPGAEECALTSVTIEPNGDGEINHGTVVSTFAKLLKGGKGCMLRHFAQSDFGKGDYDGVDAESFEVTLQSIETACEKQGKNEKNDDTSSVDDDSSSLDDDDDSSEDGRNNAPGQNKNKPAKGKDNAPGQQKKNND